jgi:hypothetical protein
VDLDGFDGTFSHGFPAMVFLTNQCQLALASRLIAAFG